MIRSRKRNASRKLCGAATRDSNLVAVGVELSEGPVLVRALQAENLMSWSVVSYDLFWAGAMGLKPCQTDLPQDVFSWRNGLGQGNSPGRVLRVEALGGPGNGLAGVITCLVDLHPYIS